MGIGLVYMAALIYLAAAATWQVLALPVPLVHAIPVGPFAIPALQNFVAGVPIGQLLIGVGGFALLYALLWWIAQQSPGGYDALMGQPEAWRHPFLDSGGMPWLNVLIGAVSATTVIVGVMMSLGDLVFFGGIALVAASAAVFFGQRAGAAAEEAITTLEAPGHEQGVTG